MRSAAAAMRVAMGILLACAAPGAAVAAAGHETAGPMGSAANATAAAAARGPAGSMVGYRSSDVPAQAQWEARFRSLPRAENVRETMRRLSARPHHVGSPYDRDNAEWILARFREWGLDAHIESFNVLFPTPRERALELLEPVRFTARLEEPPQSGDPTSGPQSEQLPPYNAYSIDGDVTAPLIYVNYGVPGDYRELDSLGISVRGAIVIARYGGSWRGIKPKVAAEHGAVGCIIYSDPRDDGYFGGDVFPRGAYRNRDGVQRGSVMDMPIHPGDPLTPGVGATASAHRLALRDVDVFTRIPVLPVSYGDAQPLLEQLRGPVAPEAWRGALPLTYHIGPGPARVHLRVKSNWDLKPIYDVIARIPGSVSPEEWVIRGNHHDAWVCGAEDPLSGQAALLEEAHAMGQLVREGWRPRRTLVYCAWDGEEPGLLGSTEWAETHAEELRRGGALYVNSDGNGRGFLECGGSHVLESFLNGVGRDVMDPETRLPVIRRARLRRLSQAGSAEDREDVRTREDVRLSPLGSGSDYTAFIDHLGVASLNLGFGGEDGGGVYHSAYDDFYWYTHFSDTSFAYGVTLAQTAGTAMMRCADAPLLPFQFGDLSDTIRRYVDEVQRLLKSRQDEVRERNRRIDEGLYAAVSDPRRPTVPPKREEMPPYLNFAPLQNGLDTLARSAARYDQALARLDAARPASLASVNRLLLQSERRLTLPDGLPRRPWFRHQIYAPGFYTGYGVKTLPGVREAIEERHWKEAGEQIARVSKVFVSEAALIHQASEELERAER